MTKIFISYSRKDQEFVDTLIRDLEARGFDCWVDREDIEGGAAWRKEISRSIRQCGAFLIVISPDSMASEVVGQELGLAELHRRPIVPIMRRACELPPGIDLQLSHLQWVDFEATPYDDALEGLVATFSSTTESPAEQRVRANTTWKKLTKVIGGFYLLSALYHLLGLALFLVGANDPTGEQTRYLASLTSVDHTFLIVIGAFNIVGGIALLCLCRWSFYVFVINWCVHTLYTIRQLLVAVNSDTRMGILVSCGVFTCAVYYIYRLHKRGVLQTSEGRCAEDRTCAAK